MYAEFNNENEIERFGTSIEFLVELSDNIMGKVDLRSRIYFGFSLLLLLNI